jgi:DNA (cytosine-5)-methyltransferase 1
MMIVLSLFDGISCGRIALERAGIKVDKYYASEIDKYAEKISSSNYSDIIRLGDITNWREWEIETPDIILAGFPCQPYSVAGKRKGLDDKRGGNIVDCMIGVIEKYQPKDFLLENVTGLLSIDKGETFKTILSELNRAGYAVDWITINSALVSAQNRERLYILGKRLDKCKGLEYYIDIDSSNKKNYQNSLF